MKRRSNENEEYMAAFFELTPQWIRFEQFWISLKRRNIWLIQLRYGAVVLLILFIAAFEFIPQLRLQSLPLAIISACILIYNILLHYFVRFIPDEYGPFHGLHFALIQISADFVALLLFVYFTGGIETPFHVFFIFHVIIGSLILPGRIVATIIICTLMITGGGALLELAGTIPHQRIDGLLAFSLYDNVEYLVMHFSIFAIALFISNYLANSISKELYQRERALNKAYLQLKDAEKQKSRYVMSVVHDLKTPIAAAMTYLDMMRDGTLGELPEKYDKPVNRSYFRLNGAISMIGDVLQLSQVKLAAEIEPEHVSILSLLEEVYSELKVLFDAKNIEFTIDQGENGGDYVIEGEPKLLKLALGNLLSNARKYTDENGKVSIFLRKDDSMITIEVADNGIGIPENEISKIFQDFYRTSLSKKKGIEGTGLGISVVLHVVREHHGELTVQSPSIIGDGAGRPGTAFIVKLPLHYKRDFILQESGMVN